MSLYLSKDATKYLNSLGEDFSEILMSMIQQEKFLFKITLRPEIGGLYIFCKMDNKFCCMEEVDDLRMHTEDPKKILSDSVSSVVERLRNGWASITL